MFLSGLPPTAVEYFQISLQWYAMLTGEVYKHQEKSKVP